MNADQKTMARMTGLTAVPARDWSLWVTRLDELNFADKYACGLRAYRDVPGLLATTNADPLSVAESAA
jgi:hypothetical protein